MSRARGEVLKLISKIPFRETIPLSDEYLALALLVLLGVLFFGFLHSKKEKASRVIVSLLAGGVLLYFWPGLKSMFDWAGFDRCMATIGGWWESALTDDMGILAMLFVGIFVFIGSILALLFFLVFYIVRLLSQAYILPLGVAYAIGFSPLYFLFAGPVFGIYKLLCLPFVLTFKGFQKVGKGVLIEAGSHLAEDREERVKVKVRGGELAKMVDRDEEVIIPEKFSKRQIRKDLARYKDSSNKSALMKYVKGLSQRFGATQEIKTTEKLMKLLDVEEKYWVAYYRGLKAIATAKGDWERVPKEIQLEDKKVETQLLKHEVAQKNLREKLQPKAEKETPPPDEDKIGKEISAAIGKMKVIEKKIEYRMNFEQRMKLEHPKQAERIIKEFERLLVEEGIIGE